MTNGVFPFTITICGIEELAGHCDVGISHVLSILDPGYPPPPVFGSFGEHERLELRFHDVIEEHVGVVAPQRADIEALLAFGRDLQRKLPLDAHLLVHCHLGISRSPAAMALILAQAHPDLAAAEIFSEIHRIRPSAWPNLRIIEFGDDVLGRNGELVVATRDLYRAQLERRPEMAQAFIEGGRGREVEAARGGGSIRGLTTAR